MEDVLLQMGLPPKEVQIYLLLLSSGAMPATAIARQTGEKRSNVYMLLESLGGFGLVEPDDTLPVRQFRVAPPAALTQLVRDKQDKQARLATSLSEVMPRIRSLHALSSNKPGVVHMAGIDGYRSLLNDMARSQTDVLLIASNESVADCSVHDVLLKGLAKRKARGVNTRAVFHSGNRNEHFRKLFAVRGIDLRFSGTSPYRGEVVIYDDSVAFTVYVPTVVITVVTDIRVAQTMRQIFEVVWQQASPD